jgi:hypothetical protein
VRALRSIAAVVAGLMAISLIVEAIELTLVTIVNGGMTMDPVVYFGTRNRPWFLAIKLVYNTAGAVAGGWLTAWLAGRAPMAHGIALAVVQAAALGYAVTDPAMRQWTPDWMWAALAAVSTFGVILGARLRQRRMTARPA